MDCSPPDSSVHGISCCCQVTSVVSDSVRPHRRQPTRLRRPWDSPGKNTGVGYHFLLQCMKVKSESEVAQLCQTLATPWTAAYQAPPSMGFSRQEYWSRVPSPSPGGLPVAGIEAASPALLKDSLPVSHRGSSCKPVQNGRKIKDVVLGMKKQSYFTLPVP